MSAWWERLLNSKEIWKSAGKISVATVCAVLLALFVWLTVRRETTGEDSRKADSDRAYLEQQKQTGILAEIKLVNERHAAHAEEVKNELRDIRRNTETTAGETKKNADELMRLREWMTRRISSADEVTSKGG
jgi:hypothetical protein